MFFATDIANFLACQHIATLNREQAEGKITKKVFADPGNDLLKRLGLEHEQKYLRELIDVQGLKVVEIKTDIPWSGAAAATREAMAAGAEAIYQATFLDSAPTASVAADAARGGRVKHPSGDAPPGTPPARGPSEEIEWGGRADFLIRVETPGSLGPWSYEVVETKLAKSTKARALIQLCFYSELVAAIQGKEPEKMHVVLGRGAQREEFSLRRYLAYFRKIKREFQAALAAMPITYPEPVEHCGVCDWFPHCDERWHREDHMSLVAGITRNQRHWLIEREINTMANLASLTLPMTPRIERIAPTPLTRIREQARIQVEGREQGKYLYELLDPDQLREKQRVRRKEALASQLETKEPATQQAIAENESLRGLAALPAPSPGDLFLDFEGDPFAFEQGLEYLIGTVRIENDGKTIHETTRSDTNEDDSKVIYDVIWSFNPAEEKKAFESFIAKVMVRWQQYPDMHIYHYAPYETTAIKHLSGRHNVCADEVDQLLRAQVFVDLHRVVRQGLRASVESYSIKKMEVFYGFKRTVPLRNATSSLQAFETVLALGDDPAEAQEILKTIADYNRDDCVSTLRLRDWLETLRVELEAKLGTRISRPQLTSGAPSEGLKEQLSQIAVLKETLVAGLPEQESEWTNEQQAKWLLAQLLEWHRREDKSMWWEYYRLCTLSDEELIEDKNALGGLVYVGVVDETPRSFVHRYQFPVQDHSIDRARKVHDPNTEDAAGTLVKIDVVNLTIDLKRGKKSDKPHPTALIPHNYIGSDEQVESLMRIASWVAENGISDDAQEPVRNKPFQAARDVLLRREPRLAKLSIEAVTNALSPLEAAKRLGLALDCSILPIQGPPGSGKTYTGAQMIVELVNAGKRVGITANSHKVISNLLAAVCEAAGETKTKLSIVQKSNESDGCEHALVIQADDNGEVLEKLQNREAQIAAGTTWLWSREEFAGSIDVLFVDEAGQMSLANVLAISPAARSVVLLGDPQQLDQPQKGVHPPGSEVSALAHLLNGRTTIEPHQGLFLGESWRLHPDICAFTTELFYDGRLMSRPENRKLRLNCRGATPWAPLGAVAERDVVAKEGRGTISTEGRPRSAAPTTPFDGTGLRYVPVVHSGNQSDAPEEVERIAELVEELLRNGATWTNKKGETRPLELKHILIVAPYNAQVALLARRLPNGARVGTVDKFQGQEAPVVFYSMTTSTPEDAPRGMEFLYSANRLNVATSRAQCVTVLVANPALFDVQCKTPRQIELANAFCRYLEMAKV
ncbi:MAG: TM0106 family RecB-like putative nuclease [Acidobacteriota bacterium]